ncbi:hypothetical protein [Salinispira pacifica]
MEALSTDIRDELIGTLQGLITHTEEIYLNLARQYPMLLSEMDRSLERSRGLAEHFGEANGRRTHAGPIDAAASLTELISQTRDLISGGGERFQRMHARDEELFSALDEGIRKLSSLDTVIGRIKEDSIEMELISLNAMTVALKAGSAGRAFSYITEELKRLSTRTISLTEEITSRGEQLLRIFHDFRTALSEVKEFQDNLFTNLRSKLDTSFTGVQEGINRASTALGSISSRSAQIRKPLHTVMEEIQLQDIIKQSIDHVIISLRELSSASAFETTEERLDELAFFQQLPDLCHSLLEDVARKIENSMRTFRAEIGAARSVISEVEQERNQFVSGALGKVEARKYGNGSLERSGESLDMLFERSTSVLRGLMTDLSRSISMKEQIAERSRGLMNEVFRLEEGFKSFAIVINRFHSIDIASRIEVVKQSVLQKMSGTVDEMTSLTERIERDVNESLDSIKVFIKTVSETVSEFRKVFQEEEEFVARFEKSIRSSYGRLFQEKNSLTDTITGFSLFTGSFLSLFDSTSQDLTRLEELLKDISQIRSELDEIKRITRSEMEPLLARKGVTTWTIGNHKLQEIITRFTIFTHKKRAGDLAGFDVEEGVESGTVTLF